MSGAALAGGFADPPIASARAFRAILDAMARPGRIVTLTGAVPPPPLSPAAGVAALVLLDRTTPVWLAPDQDVPAVREWLAFHTGAPLAAPGAARFALGDWPGLQPLARFAVGTPEYPDRSATLIVELPALSASGARLAGPGIAGAAHLSLPETAAFAANGALWPLGLDFLFCAGDRLAALPRSTRVEAA
jgi:alpha-D-ribose 1-methylphosphonate 5-triphosphate synthase subunit PhnH